MKQIELEELKEIQLEILDQVHNFCIANNIKYWIDCGTLLGAIRHKGYIPWDDDIDVGMLREDYERFIHTFNDQNTKYKCYSIENNKRFGYSFAKVLDTDTILYEPNKHGMKSAVNIDIFVYDNAPDDDKLTADMFKKRDFYRAMNNIRVFHLMTHEKLSGRICKRILNVLLMVFPRYYFAKKVADNSKRYINESTKRVGDFMSLTDMTCDKRVFSSFIDVEFEGKLYKAPVGYDEYLRGFYGDYMQLPPVEERTPHHMFEAYHKEER
jgi:lipopolysaccharide cholinephosphotransferase